MLLGCRSVDVICRFCSVLVDDPFLISHYHSVFADRYVFAALALPALCNIIQLYLLEDCSRAVPPKQDMSNLQTHPRSPHR